MIDALQTAEAMSTVRGMCHCQAWHTGQAGSARLLVCRAESSPVTQSPHTGPCWLQRSGSRSPLPAAAAAAAS